MRFRHGRSGSAFTRGVLDIVYVAAILALTALVALLARAVGKL